MLIKTLCKNCIFYRPYNPPYEKRGECHLEPPKVVVLNGNDVDSFLPNVEELSFCQHHRLDVSDPT